MHDAEPRPWLCLEALFADRLAAFIAGLVAALIDSAQSLVDVVELSLDDLQGGQVPFALEGLGAQLGRVLVDLGELSLLDSVRFVGSKSLGQLLPLLLLGRQTLACFSQVHNERDDIAKSDSAFSSISEEGITAMELGLSLSSELHGPRALVEQAKKAEAIGMSFAMISDHFHPWTNKQAESPFVWSVIGAIAQATTRLRLGTGVTCPLMRIHPAIIAQASATSAAMMPGRFMLGLGSGENLNEHILGDHWPEPDVRHEMLEEAVEVIRQLWSGQTVSHRGEHYTVENARIYTLPEQLPPILIAAAATKSAKLAGRIGDGMVGTAPSAETIKTFQSSGGAGKPRYGQMMVCYDVDERRARKMAFERWPTVALGGELNQELKLPVHFEQATSKLREEDVVEMIVCGTDPEAHSAKVQEYAKAGYDHIYVQQVGTDFDGFFRFYEREVMPRLGLTKTQPQPQTTRA